ncbi:unnamed protein product [Symbiodinium sp. CCMP2592]|nr:unnamed protein product [Symbiodinium sp. CCMP2592]
MSSVPGRIEGEKEKRFRKAKKGRKILAVGARMVEKGEGAHQGENPMAKAAPRPEKPPSVPAWYTELWENGCSSVPLDQMDLQPLVESSGDDVGENKKSFEKLSHPNYDVYEHGMPMPGKVMVVLDMRSQSGGKSVIWETAMNGGCIYVEMSPRLSGLAVVMFVQ